MSKVKVEKAENGAPIKMWTDGVQIEDAAMVQHRNVATLPFIHKHVAVMADSHWGNGAAVGSVIATDKAIIPAAVGVDLGCGMMAVKTNLVAGDLPESLLEMRTAIEEAVPHGRTDNGGFNDRGAWGGASVPQHIIEATFKARDILMNEIVVKQPRLERGAHRLMTQAGTLGGGNHFIEVCVDTEDHVWVMLHSGSRGIGNAIGTLYINAAKEEMERWHIKLPDKQLAYLPEGTKLFEEYVRAVSWAQNFAKLNRDLMMKATLDAIEGVMNRPVYGEAQAINCHHNYVNKEYHFGKAVWITRKGAIRAGKGELGIIPGSMGARSYIVEGLGNQDSFNSSSHGAGRAMSRTEARKRFSLEDHAAATAGVECKKDDSVLDETPGAYKSIEAVMAAQSDLVSIVAELRQVLCVKG